MDVWTLTNAVSKIRGQLNAMKTLLDIWAAERLHL